ncbi:SMI1/KNR4 family protein [Ruminococcus sp. HUN007]|uniref:SMI1/KNR4 family protein n=1 Tax=Ruminococcus sp. HUN007 TaxID=1514668 RepID=UPI0005D180EB|nr:SMI1/KNR4 family protein [Ruminococcus sp. HUN007]
MFRISKVVKDFYDDIKLLSSYLGKSSDFSDPCAIEKIKKWEKDNNITIPKMYKSWLLLSEYAYVYGGYCELYFPELESIENDDVLIGNIIGDGDHLYFSKKQENSLAFMAKNKKDMMVLMSFYQIFLDI